jgi:light-regulated signal transduction histidine kinase (bacteriophytochrome)
MSRRARYKLRSGETRILSVFSGPIEYSGKTSIFWIMHDITEQEKAERMISELNQTLEQKVKDRTYEIEKTNEELKAFAYSVSHDLRAPLRAIEGFSSLLHENISSQLSETDLHYLDRIMYNSRRMSALIDDLLRLSRVSSQPITLTDVDLSALAWEVVDELRQSDPGRIVDIFIQEGMTAHADSALMRIVLSNLLGNAWKFTSKNPSATIRFEILQSDTDKNVFVISDNGVGFDMAYVDKLFSPFQRLHSEEEFPGTGIGLSLVQRIVLRHGGKIWVKADVGAGAQFFFTIGDSNGKTDS